MKRLILGFAVGATIVTAPVPPAAADVPLDALRLFGSFLSQADNRDRWGNGRTFYRDDDDDDGYRDRGRGYRYANDDDDDGYRGRGRRDDDDDDGGRGRWNDDDD